MSAMANWWESIRERIMQIKGGLGAQSRDLAVVIAIVLVGISAFGLGRLSSYERERPAVSLLESTQVAAVPISLGGRFVASQEGSKYHFPWCAGARSMNESNKIWFDSEEDAQRAGYTPASNCKGLK